MFLTGSKALEFNLREFFDSKRDWDLICSTSELRSLDIEVKDDWETHKTDQFGILCEFINIDLLNNRDICKNFHGVLHIPELAMDVQVLSLDSLYIQKRSHIWRPYLNFQRQIRELYKIKDSYKSMRILDENGERLLKERIKLTKEKYGHKVPSLMQKNEDFFNDAVAKYYIHDDIHKIMAFNKGRPIYEQLKFDSSLAQCERELWDMLPYEDKVRCVCEEAFVIAVERFVIPKMEVGERYPPKNIAVAKSIEKICTNLTSGWFRDFAIDNWRAITKTAEAIDFYEKLFTAIKTGELKHV